MGCTTSTASVGSSSSALAAAAQTSHEDLYAALEQKTGRSEISSSGTLLGARARSAGLRPDSVEKPRRPTSCHDVRIRLSGVQNLRPASGRKGRSDLFLHVAAEGSPDSQVSTPRVEGIAEQQQRQSATLSVDFSHEVQLRGWRTDRRIFFSVRGGVGNRLLAQAYLSPEAIYDGFDGDIPFTNSVEGTRGTIQAKVSVLNQTSSNSNRADVDLLKKWGILDKQHQRFCNPHQRQLPDEDVVFATISTADTLLSFSEDANENNEEAEDPFEDEDEEYEQAGVDLERPILDFQVASTVKVSV